MKHYLLALFLAASVSQLMLPAVAHADPFAKGDAGIGKRLVQQNCIACHAENFGGDGSGVYTRADHKVKTASGLVTQVRACNTNLGLKWFDDDEMNVAAYLNQTYYHLQ